jgi:hypothetical protein
VLKRLRFVAQLLDGEAMSEVCRAFGSQNGRQCQPPSIPKRAVRNGILKTARECGVGSSTVQRVKAEMRG